MGLISNTGPYNAAADKFGVQHGSNVLTGIPRLKYNFSVSFILNPTVPLIDESFGRAFTFDRVSSVGLPDFDYGVVRLNQYNRPRYVPTRMDSPPINILFYDTKDNQFNFLLMAYAQHYFHGHQLDSTTAGAYDVINGGFASGGASPYGARTIPDDQRFFFEEIIIKQQDTAQGGRIIRMFNCMMTNVNHDRLDYSDSNPLQYTVQFQPEHVNIEPLGASSSQAADAQAVDGGREAATVSGRAVATTVAAAAAIRLFDGNYNSSTEQLINRAGVTYVVSKIIDQIF